MRLFIILMVSYLRNIVASGSNFGSFFKVSTFGESHGLGVGVIVDGCPPKIPLNTADIQVLGGLLLHDNLLKFL